MHRSLDGDGGFARSLSIERVAVGEHYFPWNYRRRTRNGDRVTRRLSRGELGRHAFNTLDARGRIVGSADVQIGPRASQRMIATEEFAYGGGNGSRGPYLFPDAGDELYIVVLRGLWTRAAARRQGVARRLVAAVGEFGLPVYVAFANSHMERWFDDQYKPEDEWAFGEWQDSVRIFEGYLEEPWPSTARGGRYRWELTCIARRRIASGMLYDFGSPTLGELLFTPKRAEWDDLDGGAGETDIADTAFAEDRRYGYRLTVGRIEDARLEIDADPEDETSYEEALAEPVTLTASGELQVTDVDVLCDYARFRHMLRTGISNPPAPGTEADAVHELLIAAQQQPFSEIVAFDVGVTTLVAPDIA